MNTQVLDNATLSEMVRDLLSQQKQLKSNVNTIKQSVLSFLPPSSYSINYNGDDTPHTSIDQMVKDQNDVHQSVTLLIDDIGIFRKEQHDYNSTIQKQMEYLHTEVRKLREEQKQQQGNLHTCDGSVKTLSDHVYMDLQKLTHLMRTIRDQQANLSTDMDTKVGRVDTKCLELEEAMLAAIHELTLRQENSVTKVTQKAQSSFDMITRGASARLNSTRTGNTFTDTELVDVRGVEVDEQLNDSSVSTHTTRGLPIVSSKPGTARSKTYANSSRIKNVQSQTVDMHLKPLNLEHFHTGMGDVIPSARGEDMSHMLHNNNILVDLKEFSQMQISTYFQHLHEEVKKQQNRLSQQEAKNQLNIQGLVDSVQTLASQQKNKFTHLEQTLTQNNMDVRRDIGVWSTRVIGQEREMTNQIQRLEFGLTDQKKKRKVDQQEQVLVEKPISAGTHSLAPAVDSITTTTYVDKRFLELEKLISQLHTRINTKFNETLRKMNTLEGEQLQEVRVAEQRQHDTQETLLHRIQEVETRTDLLFKKHIEGKGSVGSAVQPSRVRTAKLAPASMSRPDNGKVMGFSQKSVSLITLPRPMINTPRHTQKDSYKETANEMIPSSLNATNSNVVTADLVNSVVRNFTTAFTPSRLQEIPIQGETQSILSPVPAAAPLHFHTTQSLAKVNGGNLHKTLH